MNNSKYDLDLDINNYSIKDLEKFFGLQSKSKYSSADIELKEYIRQYDTLYQTMKKVNLLIWDMMDILRDGNVTEEVYLRKCKECIEFNDVRFRVKNKLNSVTGSFLKEQKSYTINRLVLTIKTEHPLLVKIIHYLSFMYDEIIIECDLPDLKDHFKYDSTILFQECGSDYKRKVVVDKEYTEHEIYTLFQITEDELNKLI